MNIRDVAARFIETGRALGHIERARVLAAMLRARAAATRENQAEADWQARAAVLEDMAELVARGASADDEAHAAYRADAERLIAELEHPGARLARRVLAAARAARAAWRAG